MTTCSLPRASPSAASRSAIAPVTVTVALEYAIDSRSWRRNRPWTSGFLIPREADAEELRHRLVEIEDDRHAEQPQRERGKDEEIGRRMDLDDPEPLAAVEPDGRPHRPGEERQILGDVDDDPCALVALDVEVADPHAVDNRFDRVMDASQTDDVYRPAQPDERLRLATDPGVLLVVAVDDHQHRPRAAGSRRHAPVDQPAPSRRTWRSSVG